MMNYKGEINVDGENIRWESTFPQEVKFKCLQCAYCCIAANVSLFNSDIERINKKIKTKFFEPYHRGHRIVGSDFKDCIFNKNPDCSIYDSRPVVCREYPFKVTFISKNQAYIDLLYGCKCIAKEEFDSKNNVDFNELVKNRYLNQQIGFNLVKNLDEIEKNINKKRWGNNIAELNYLKDLLDLFLVFAPEEKTDFRFFVKKFFYMYKKHLKKVAPYKCVDLESGRLYSIRVKGNNITINNKIIEIKKLQRKELTEGAKILLIDYLGNLWDRKTTVFDFCYALNYLQKEGINISIYELQREVAKRLCLLLEFFLLIISEKNNSQEITERDAKETILALDSSIFTPMQSIIPGVMKKRKFFG